MNAVTNIEAYRMRERVSVGNRRYEPWTHGRPSTGQVSSYGPHCDIGSGKSTKHLAFSAVVNANAQLAIVQTPQVKFRVYRFIVPSSIATVFTIDDVRVGVVSQNAAPGTGFLAQLASETNGGFPICFNEVCDVGIQCSMTVTNLTGQATQFFAVWLGIADSPC